MSDTARRKREHLDAITQDPAIERGDSGFAAIRLTHRALPELALDEVDTRCNFLGKTLRLPLLISSMTGGDDPEIRRINHNLAQAAEHCGVALAVGSQRVQFTTPAAAASFRLRDAAPNTVLLANLGAVQLNYGFTAEHCQRAVETLAADGLYLHLNPLQEAVQPEGDTNFAGLATKIAAVRLTLLSAKARACATLTSPAVAAPRGAASNTTAAATPPTPSASPTKTGD